MTLSNAFSPLEEFFSTLRKKTLQSVKLFLRNPSNSKVSKKLPLEKGYLKERKFWLCSLNTHYQSYSLFFNRLQLEAHEKAALIFSSLVDKLDALSSGLEDLALEHDREKQKEMALSLLKDVIFLKAELTLFQQKTVFLLSAGFGPTQIQMMPPERPYVLSLNEDCYIFNQILLNLLETLRLYVVCLVKNKHEWPLVKEDELGWASTILPSDFPYYDRIVKELDAEDSSVNAFLRKLSMAKKEENLEQILKELESQTKA